MTGSGAMNRKDRVGGSWAMAWPAGSISEGRAARRAGVTRTGLARAAALAVLAALACGCGQATAGSASPPPTRPASSPAAGAGAGARAAGRPTSCNVITRAEASAALGQPVRPPVRGKAYVEGGVACVYYGPTVPPGISPDIPVGDSVRVVLVTGRKARHYFYDYRRRVNAQPVSGLGDAAFYDGYASISVLKGNAYLRIAVGIASNLSAEKVLAADALPRM
jgi:hypothetical protein